MAKNKKSSIVSRIYNRYSLLLIIILVTILVTGGISFEGSGASIGVWLTLLFLRSLIREYLQRFGIISQPTNGAGTGQAAFQHLINLVLIGAVIFFVGYITYLYLFAW